MTCINCGSEWHEGDECPKQNGDIDTVLSEDFEGFGSAPATPTSTNNQTDKDKKPYFVS